MAAVSQDDYLNNTSQFDVARKRVAQQSASNMQAKKDALSRRFSDLGNLDSGARVKIEQNAMDEENRNAANANEGIDAQQQAEMGRRREILQGQQFASGEREAGQQFATGERQGSQQFAGEQAAMQRQYATSERLGGQEFAAGENKLSRDQQGEQFGQSLAEQKEGRLQQDNQFAHQFSESIRAREQQNKQFEKTYGISVQQMKDAQDNFIKQYNHTVLVDDFNMKLAEKMSNDKGPLGNIGSAISLGGIGKSLKSNPIGTFGGALIGMAGGGLGAIAGAKIGGSKKFW